MSMAHRAVSAPDLTYWPDPVAPGRTLIHGDPLPSPVREIVKRLGGRFTPEHGGAWSTPDRAARRVWTEVQDLGLDLVQQHLDSGPSTRPPLRRSMECGSCCHPRRSSADCCPYCGDLSPVVPPGGGTERPHAVPPYAACGISRDAWGRMGGAERVEALRATGDEARAAELQRFEAVRAERDGAPPRRATPPADEAKHPPPGEAETRLESRVTEIAGSLTQWRDPDTGQREELACRSST